jgi:hypothetical protein
MVAAVGEDLEGGARARDEELGRTARTLKREFGCSELGVEAGLRAAGRIQVVQADEGRGGRLDAAVQARLRAARVERPGKA